MNKQYKLPNMEHKFKIQTVGKETGIQWCGDFTYRRPTLGERGQIDVLRASLGGDLHTVSVDIKDLNMALAHLRYTLKSYPDWWKDTNHGTSLFDSNVILDIYEKCLEFELEWHQKVTGGDSSSVEVADESTPSN